MYISKTKSRKRQALWTVCEWARAPKRRWDTCPGWIHYDDKRRVIALIIPLENL